MATPKKPTTPIKAANPYRTPEGKLTKRGRISLQQAGGAFEQQRQGELDVKPVAAARAPKTPMEVLKVAGDRAVEKARGPFVQQHVEKVRDVLAANEVGGTFDAASAARAGNEIFNRDEANSIRFNARMKIAQKIWPADSRTPEEKAQHAQEDAEEHQRRNEAAEPARRLQWMKNVKAGTSIIGGRIMDTDTGEQVGSIKPGGLLKGPGSFNMDPAKATEMQEADRKAAFATPEGQAWLEKSKATAEAQRAATAKAAEEKYGRRPDAKEGSIDRIPTYKFGGRDDEAGNGLDLPKEWTSGAPTGTFEGTEGASKIAAAKEAKKMDPVAVVDDRAARKAKAQANKTTKREAAKGGFVNTARGARVYRNKQ